METVPIPKKSTGQLVRVVGSAMVGNALEWYDFSLFGYLAVPISKNFFPSVDPMVSYLSTFAVFAGAFFMRPVGGVIFGHIGDKLGRKNALMISILGVALPTVLMGIIPGYSTIGVAATWLLTVTRLLQGLSVGGEFAGSMLFLVEHATPARHCFCGSLAFLSAVLGILLGAVMGSLVTSIFSPATLVAWAWRIPFLLGITTGAAAIWMRVGVQESHAFQHVQATGTTARLPLHEVLRTCKLRVLVCMILPCANCVGVWMVFMWMPAFLMDINVPRLPSASWIGVLTLALSALCIFFFGILADRKGPGKVMAVSALGLGVLSWPLFILVHKGTWGSALPACLIWAVLVSGFVAPEPALIIEFFPPHLRYTGVAVAFNLSQAIFGGTAPLVATALIRTTGYVPSPGIYLSIIGFISCLALILVDYLFTTDAKRPWSLAHGITFARWAPQQPGAHPVQHGKQPHDTQGIDVAQPNGNRASPGLFPAREQYLSQGKATEGSFGGGKGRGKGKVADSNGAFEYCTAEVSVGKVSVLGVAPSNPTWDPLGVVDFVVDSLALTEEELGNSANAETPTELQAPQQGPPLLPASIPRSDTVVAT